MHESDYLFVLLLEGFDWFDEGLQQSLRAAGIKPLTRTESMIMAHVQRNVVRPSDIARSLRLTRQAVHQAIAALVERGLFELRPDPTDGRVKTVHVTAEGNAMRAQARAVVEQLTEALAFRIGQQQIDALRSAFRLPWGEPVTVSLPGSIAGAAGPQG